MLALEDVAEVLALYAKALAGRSVELATGPAGEPDGGLVRLSVPAQAADFEWYKVLVTHQTGHLECGTAELDLEGLLRTVDDRPLLASLFELCEDFRVDSHMRRRYPGLAPAYRRACEASARDRRRPETLPAREAFLERLVQHTLHPDAPSPAAAGEGWGEGTPPPGEGMPLLDRLAAPGATVQDAADAALRLYAIAATIPNVALDACCDPEHGHAHDFRPSDSPGKPGAVPEAAFKPPHTPDFRARFDAPPGDESAAPEGEPTPAEDLGDRPLGRDTPHAYLYPEWDFRAQAYRERWCRVHEETAQAGSSEFYARALRDHHQLVLDIEQRFQHLFPELFRKKPRQLDGEDFDLDSLVELVVDRRAGTTPSEKLYWRRERTQRDVAVALLLDMSATTGEYIVMEPAAALEASPTSAAGYSAYLERIAHGVDERGKQLRKQVIQIEKEAAVVLVQALEKVGDAYAVYAFSGSGRGDVQFVVAKDFDEPLDQRVAKRLDTVRPAHATRMGAAIRHTVRKFKRMDAQTRLLVVVSDGRPYDRDYGAGDEDLEYAVHDTRRALEEARRQLIRPFCLTVDKSGADYLDGMCADLPYEVVDRVEDLPRSLLAAYPRLTA
jgi:hypothetical protein